MKSSINKLGSTVVDRFLKYVKIDTQAIEGIEKIPSNPNQMVLGKLLLDEFKEMGIEDAYMDDIGIVYATLKSNTDKKNVPVIGLLAHLDTSPEFSGKDIKPVLHKNYDGKNITLPGDKTQIIKVSENPDLKNFIGDTVITSDGTTLLGSDDKSGIAEIMDVMNYLIDHPEIKHGEIKAAFIPDEEIGKGIWAFDVKKFKADVAYTLDASGLAKLGIENFWAESAKIVFEGKNSHPGDAKGNMINSMKAAGHFLSLLPEDISPENTDNKQGFFHPYKIEGGTSKTEISFILRDFIKENIEKQKKMLESLSKNACARVKDSKYNIEFKEQYGNMSEWLKKTPWSIDIALDAIKMAGMEPIIEPVRGGTDGVVLSQKGLPTPDLFAGQYSVHSKLEFTTEGAMRKACEVILNLIKIYEEKS